MKKLLLGALVAGCLWLVPTVSEARVGRAVYVGPGWNRTVVRYRGWRRPVVVGPAPVVVTPGPVWAPAPVWAPGPVVVPQRTYYRGPVWVW